MDYKYIEQLLQRYWQCETTPEEENVLRAFFAQPCVPAKLAHYKALFVYEQQESKTGLDEDFDKRLYQLAGVKEEKEEKREVVRARRVTFIQRLRPLYHAAAVIAVVVVLGNAVQYAFDGTESKTEWDYNPNNYQDSYNNPQEAYETLNDGIEELKDALISSSDSSHIDSSAVLDEAISPDNLVRP